MRKGITIAGNVVADKIKLIDFYPEKGMLANVLGVSNSVGGCVPNTSITLKTLDPGLPVYAAGRVGGDFEGEFVRRRMQSAGVDVSGLSQSPELPTGFTDVMTVKSTGERTFFTAAGANAEFTPKLALENLSELVHIGYLLLLESFDAPDPEYGTRMAGFLREAQNRGCATSIDAVSSSAGKFKEIVCPALKYCDYVVLNEIEAGSAVGIDARDDAGRLCAENVRRILEALMERGVSRRAVIHCPEAGFSLNGRGAFTAVPSLELPEDYIAGTVGAGDAFCAGMLYAFAAGMSDREALELASCSAACNLASKDSVGGARDLSRTLELDKKYGRKAL